MNISSLILREKSGRASIFPMTEIYLKKCMIYSCNFFVFLPIFSRHLGSLLARAEVGVGAFVLHGKRHKATGSVGHSPGGQTFRMFFENSTSTWM